MTNKAEKLAQTNGKTDSSEVQILQVETELSTKKPFNRIRKMNGKHFRGLLERGSPSATIEK